MKLNELLKVIDTDTKLKIMQGENEIIANDKIKNEGEVQNIINGISSLVIKIK